MRPLWGLPPAPPLMVQQTRSNALTDAKTLRLRSLYSSNTVPLSFSSRITSATKLMCSFWAYSAASTPMLLTRTDSKSPERVEMPENTWPGIVEVGTPMTYRFVR